MASKGYKAFSISKPKDDNVPVYTPSKEDEEVLRIVDQRYYDAKESRKTRETIWNYSYLQFKSINYYNRQYGQEFLEGFGLRVFVPRTFETIESIIPQLNGRPPEFIVSGKNPQDDKRADFIDIVLSNEWDRADTQRQITISTFDSLVFGTGILLNYLRDDRREVEEINEVDDDGNVISYEKEEFVDYFGVYSKSLDPYNCFPDPNADENKDSLRFFVYREVVDVDELREEYRLKGFNDNWKYLTEGGNVDDFGKIRQEIDTIYTATDVRTPGNFSDLIGQGRSTVDRKIKKNLIEKFTYFEKDRMVVIANGVVLRDTPSPFPHKTIPISVIRDYALSHEFWGMGEPEIIRWLQVESNTLHNLALDATAMSVGQMIAVNSAYIQDESELVVKPFGIVHLKPIPGLNVRDAIQPVVTPDVKSSVFRMMQENKSITQSTTGVSDFIIGASKGGAETATEANRLAEASVARIREKARIIEQEGVKDIVEQWMPMIAEFYSEDMVFRITKKDKTEFIKFVSKNRADLSQEEIEQYKQEGYMDVITVDDLRGKFDITVKGASTLPVNKDIIRGMWMQLLNLAASIKRTDGTDVFNVDKIAYETLKEGFERQDALDFLSNVNPDIIKEGGDQLDELLASQGPQTEQTPLPVSPTALPDETDVGALLQRTQQPQDMGNNLLGQ